MLLKEILETQDKFLENGNLETVSKRLDYLKILNKEIKKNREEILQALKNDIGKTLCEGFITEYQIVTGEIKYFINNLYDLLEVKKTGTSLNIFPGKGKIIRKPYGKILVQSPWNYPFQLSMVPIIGAIASGNTIVLKTSSKVPETNKVLQKIINVLPDELCYFGNSFSHEEILNEKYDLYFFTGSKNIGKLIYKKAAENLKPVVLELGGKSPCIVDETAKINDAAKKLAWGKFINSGQTCIAPDYVFVHKNVKAKLVDRLKKEIEEKYNNVSKLPNIITSEKVTRLSKLIKDRVDIYGGEFNIENRVFKPTLLIDAKLEDEIMKEEIFGPILPIIEYENLDEVIKYIKSRDNPLALYIFSKSKKNTNRIVGNINFGGGCINDVIMHIAENKLPFGGVGGSGLGSYHGEYSIETFSRKVGIVETQSSYSNSLRYPPYTKKKFNIIKKILG